MEAAFAADQAAAAADLSLEELSRLYDESQMESESKEEYIMEAWGAFKSWLVDKKGPGASICEDSLKAYLKFMEVSKGWFSSSQLLNASQASIYSSFDSISICDSS